VGWGPVKEKQVNQVIKTNGSKTPASFLKKAIFFIIPALMCFGILEGTLRFIYPTKNTIFHERRDYDKKYGWRTVANVSRKRSYEGLSHETNYSTVKYGFRKFGNPETVNTKIFVIGDSQTLAKRISDGDTYYDVVKEKTGAEIFAYGGRGYGTLQEYMILDDYVDEIKPDIILWQFSNNDFINNSFELESSSWKNNNHRTRPYYRNGQIEYKFPHSSWLYRNILRHSYLIKLFYKKIVIRLAKNRGRIPLDDLSLQNPDFKKSIETTSKILRLVKKRAKETPIVAFKLHGRFKNRDIDKALVDILRELNIFYIHGLVDSLKEEAKKRNINYDDRPHDNHLNRNGNLIVGQIISEYLIEKKFIKIADRTESGGET